MNPGPHGPESDGGSSNRAVFYGFRFEISDPAALLVQNWVKFPPDYYLNYYTAAPF